MKNRSMKHYDSASASFVFHLHTVWHGPCFEMVQEAVSGVVGLVDCINSAGV